MPLHPLLFLLSVFLFLETVITSPTTGLWAVKFRGNGRINGRINGKDGEEGMNERMNERMNRREVLEGRGMRIMQEFMQMTNQDYYLVEPVEGSLHSRSSESIKNSLLSHDEIEWAELQVPLNRQKREYFSDPSYSLQWHLENNGQTGSPSGNDINVLPVWKQKITGSGVIVAMVDDGLDYLHDDLAANYFQEGSFDFNFGDNDPYPDANYDNHGTRCAGEISAIPNKVCGVGVAYESKISGIRLISESPTDADEANALTFKNDLNQIYSNSWGPSDDGRTVESPGRLSAEGFKSGVTNGRNGLGSIYVFASGNGHHLGDDCNFDGYANSIYTMAIGAITDNNNLAQYSEGCSALYAVTYSSGGAAGIASTDIHGACTNKHSGTSAAAPIAAGMIALALSVRPELTWRDVQHLVVHSTRIVNEGDGEWQTNGAGYKVHHRYGFGNMDASLLVENSKNWTLVKTQYSFHSGIMKASKALEQASPVVLTYSVYSNNTEAPRTLEYVVVTVTLSHEVRGDLLITLLSPEGTTSVLAPLRHMDKSNQGFNDWSFTTVRCWGENPIGVWALRIDTVGSSTGLIKTWGITFYGMGAKEQQDYDDPINLTWILVLGAAIGLTAVGIIISGVALYLWRRSRNRATPVRSNSGDSFDLDPRVMLMGQEDVYEQGVFVDQDNDDGDRLRINVDDSESE